MLKKSSRSEIGEPMSGSPARRSQLRRPLRVPVSTTKAPEYGSRGGRRDETMCTCVHWTSIWWPKNPESIERQNW